MRSDQEPVRMAEKRPPAVPGARGLKRAPGGGGGPLTV